MPDASTVIRNGKIVDGTGNPWFYGDVAVSGDRVVDVTPPGLIPRDGVENVDASGMVVCPGFIDIQSHSVVPLMMDVRCLSKITQGVTTEIMGEAWTPAPFGGRIESPIVEGPAAKRIPEWVERARTWSRFSDWLQAMVDHGVSPNVGSFLGGGTLRAYAMGHDMRQPTNEELETMRRVMAQAMDDGAFGVSYALIYPPDTFAETDELVEVCRVMKPGGGVYITHIRSEGDRLIEGIDEAIEIGRRSGVPVEIYHLKAAGTNNWQKMPDVIDRINAARDEGLDVTADMYPYIAAGTGLSSVLPPWVANEDATYQILRDPAIRARVRAETENPSGEWEALAHRSGPEGVMPVGFVEEGNKQYAGKRLTEIAEMRGQDWIDAAMDLLADEKHRIATIYFVMHEDNLALQLRQPWMKISTDAGGVDPEWAEPLGPTHPRAYGTYPRVLAKYVREERVIPVEDAIRKMTSSVADRIGLRDRGILRAGCYADVVIFDPETVADRATFERPHQLSTGVRDVWVNGTRVLRDGEHTGATPGMFVKGPGATSAP